MDSFFVDYKVVTILILSQIPIFYGVKDLLKKNYARKLRKLRFLKNHKKIPARSTENNSSPNSSATILIIA